MSDAQTVFSRYHVIIFFASSKLSRLQPITKKTRYRNRYSGSKSSCYLGKAKVAFFISEDFSVDIFKHLVGIINRKLMEIIFYEYHLLTGC